MRDTTGASHVPRIDDENDDAPKFFTKDNAVLIKLYYDEKREAFVAVATLDATGEIITEAQGEEDPADALEDIAGTLMLMTEKPALFNDKLRVIGENASKKLLGKSKTDRKVVTLR